MVIDIYQQRRVALLNQLPENSLVLLAGYQQKVRSKNIKYHFRQDNNFLYLTGFDEPDAIALLIKNKTTSFHLFLRPKDRDQEVNFGTRAGISGAIEHYNADHAYPVSEFTTELLCLMDGISNLYICDENNRFSSEILSWANHHRHNGSFDTPKQFVAIKQLVEVLHPHRLIKSEEEINNIRLAVAGSTYAHKKVMQACSPGINERELSALFNFSIAKKGCSDVAYPNIVASGNNACCLHYEENCCELEDGQMLLIDAGAEYQYYASDITRSYPVNGKFSKEQKAIYQIVLNALDCAIEIIRPGLSWNSIHETCMKVMAIGLKELGLLTGSIEHIMTTESYKRFTVHKTGHWLGMDVHDVGPYHDTAGNWHQLVNGMVFTIEPGIYIPLDAIDIPEGYRGMGIRIEDDILVTDSSFENLSKDIPRTVDEIEAFMAKPEV
ncbi:aminopeptidase P N-terminal domain-containing protein [Shewanella kaireitica]|uniref:aminopeptidase P N-terminal domain-containing protein n=1 Tax=Shewanella kaireitica TaxID=212021 RepID=UPI00200C8639|nr:aminopeptidase P N-terminal domain-containing protein [Shewanella kaireitica]